MLIQAGGWVAFNIKARFLSDRDDTGYRDAIEVMMGDSIDILEKTRYCHRLSLSGEPLYYYAIIGRKIKNPYRNIVQLVKKQAFEGGGQF